jgi:hypothetical protein
VFCSSGSLSLTIMCITVVLPSGSDNAVVRVMEGRRRRRRMSGTYTHA